MLLLANSGTTKLKATLILPAPEPSLVSLRLMPGHPPRGCSSPLILQLPFSPFSLPLSHLPSRLSLFGFQDTFSLCGLENSGTYYVAQVGVKFVAIFFPQPLSPGITGVHCHNQLLLLLLALPSFFL